MLFLVTSNSELRPVFGEAPGGLYRPGGGISGFILVFAELFPRLERACSHSADNATLYRTLTQGMAAIAR
jgi:hypothetical protein